LLNHSTFEGLQETTYHNGLHACEICGREVMEKDVCSGCEQWVEQYAEMLPISREMQINLL
jgi:hypothetical protein